MTLHGTELPSVTGPLPGPRSSALVDVLARHECPAVTARRARRAHAIGADHDDPIVWEEAVGSVVRDADGNVLVDWQAGFGVALVGHRHPAVVAAVEAQAKKLVHAMGDAFPDVTRIRMLERLGQLAPRGLDVAILGLSGSDAVEAAVKTAVLATGRTGVLTFEGGYHGLALGAVALQAYNARFTEPFRGIVHPEVRHLPWGCDRFDVEKALADETIGLVLVEPVQGRGGMRTAPPGWIADVAAAARASGALVAFDEVFSGFGRTGTRWACDAEGAVPDLMCVGKALGGGFPLSACLGTRSAMDAWGASTGEAIHTQTFLGHPIGCAAALAVLDLVEGGLPERAAERGAAIREAFEAAGYTVRGRGLMIGVHVDRPLAVSRMLLQKGHLVLPAGNDAIGLTPPVTVTDAQIAHLVDAVSAATR